MRTIGSIVVVLFVGLATVVLAQRPAVHDRAIAISVSDGEIRPSKEGAGRAAAEECFVNSIGMKLKLIQAGTFLMGASTADAEACVDERPQHKITISMPFYLGVFEVTQQEYRLLIGENPSSFQESERHPVDRVSAVAASRFCNILSDREHRRPYYKIVGDAVTVLGGDGYRLPTEAEWEYACRAPRSVEDASAYPFGNDASELAEYAWFDKNSDGKTHPVGQKKPNRWGLYDMQGNVWEWCQDGYERSYYQSSAKVDPSGPVSSEDQVFRGGSWYYGSRYARPAFRRWNEPVNGFDDLGFRVAATRTRE